MATLVFEHSDDTGIDRLGEILRDHGHRLRIVQLHRGDPVPGDLDDVDAIVSCGGPQSPLDDRLDWLEPQMDLLRQASALDLPVLGICLGEILARALDGTVAELDGGIEAGWHDVKLTAAGREDPIYNGIAWQSTQLHWHRFHVAEPPAGARVLASSERTKVQAWARGLRTYGIQYHPESYPDTVERWAEDEPKALEEAGMSLDHLRQRTEQHYQSYARLAERLFRSIALLLMPVDRRFAGIAKDMHH
jgi:GMP synthase-like glutamine amidotransferase